jgi:hypothetical protein
LPYVSAPRPARVSGAILALLAPVCRFCRKLDAKTLRAHLSGRKFCVFAFFSTLGAFAVFSLSLFLCPILFRANFSRQDCAGPDEPKIFRVGLFACIFFVVSAAFSSRRRADLPSASFSRRFERAKSPGADFALRQRRRLAVRAFCVERTFCVVARSFSRIACARRSVFAQDWRGALI